MIDCILSVYSKDNDVLLLLWVTWSIKCLSCTSSSLRSVRGGELSIWSKIHSVCWCLLPRIKEPLLSSISCLHPQDRKEKHTHKANPFEQSVDSFIISGWFPYFCLLILLPFSITQSPGPRQPVWFSYLTHHSVLGWEVCCMT